MLSCLWKGIGWISCIIMALQISIFFLLMLPVLRGGDLAEELLDLRVMGDLVLCGAHAVYL